MNQSTDKDTPDTRSNSTDKDSALERVSSLATISRHESGLAIGASLIGRKAADARASERQREIHILHAGDHDNPQRMLNALQPGSYITPHRHHTVPKAESLIILSGAAGVVVFDDRGEPLIEACLTLNPSVPGGSVAFDLRAGVWHTMFALEPDTVLYEMKAGPYDASNDKQFAPWAPAEGDQDAAQYLANLEDRLRSRFGLGTRRWIA